MQSQRTNQVLAQIVSTLFCGVSMSYANLSVFDFQSAWTGAKEDDFATFASNAPSVDTDPFTTTSLLSNSGFSSGGYGSFALKDSVAGTSIFSTSATPDVGMNAGAANQGTPTHYISFTVTPTSGHQATYTSLTLYTDTSINGDAYDLQLTAIDGSGAPVVMGTHSHTPSSANEPVHLVTFDFPDFSSTEITEWRLYGYNTAAVNNGIRFDDITLNGSTAPISTHYRVYFLGGQSNGNGRGDAAQLTEPLASPQLDVPFYWHRTQTTSNVGHLTEDAWISLAPGSGHGTTSPVYAKEFGSELSFGRTMADADPSVNIALIKYTHGGTNLHTQWSASGTMYASFLATAQAGLAALTSAGHTYELGGMIWHQGEADAGTLTNANAYEANLNDLISRVRQDVFGGAKAPFIIGSLSNSQNASIETPGSSWYVLRQAQESVAQNGIHVGFVNTDGYSTRPDDAIHFDHAGQIDLGEGFASEMLRLEEASSPTTLIEATFDGVDNDTNNTFSLVTNTPGINGGASWNAVTGVVDRGTNNFATSGMTSDTTVDFTTLGGNLLALTFISEGGSGNISSNGMFLGFLQATGSTDGAELWNNLAPSFGLVINGSQGGLLGDLGVGPGGRAPAGSSSFQDGPSYGTTTNASINDGFTVVLTLSSSGYDIAITGLETAGGTPITGGSGTWDDSSFSFTDFSSTMHVGVSTQQGNPGVGGTIDLASVNLVVEPEPDTDWDGMPDSYEMANGTDIHVNDANLDKDEDRLTNLQEYLGHNSTDSPTGYGQTLSGTADSDGDNLNDGDEVDGSLNPWTAGVLGSTPGDPHNPNEVDSDQDGDDDDVEITNGTDPNNPPPNTGPVFPFVDTDGDSYSDLAETGFGSNPNDPEDCPDHSSSPVKPNVVIIYADDMGLGDMSAYGDLFGTPSPAVTPRMNALAAEGTLFTQAHSANAVCTPSRYSLLTGKYNWREFDNISQHYGAGPISEIPKASDVTIAEYLKTEAYDTAAFGKWHLGGAWYAPGSNTRITGNPSSPTAVDWARPVENHAVAHGFDTFQGLATTINFGPYVYLENDRNQIWDATLNGGAGGFRNATNSDTFIWLTTSNLNSSVVGAKDSRASLGDPTYRQVDAEPFMIDQVEAFIAERNTSGDPDPFFAYVSLYSPHKPWALTAPFIGSDSAAGFHYADWMREVDDRIGRVIDAIDNNGFENNTIIILTSDNGPENTAMFESLSFNKDPNGPLRGNKRDVWEGGTRVPFVIRWPDQAAPGLKVSDPIWQGDIFATVAAYLGTDLPATTAPDGESFLNLIRGQQKPAPQRAGIVMSSIRGDLGLKTIDGWKFIDATAGGHNTSWDSSNASISGAEGTNQGVPKQLFHLDMDLGEDFNLISSITDTSEIRDELTSRTGSDLLATLDQLRINQTSVLYPRVADNDADSLPNSYELQYGLDLNSPKDASMDLDGDGSSNGDEYVAGTDPSDPNDFFRVINLQDTPSEFTVTWSSVVGRTYTVSWSTDLQAWTPDSIHSGTGGLLSAPLDKAEIDDVDEIPGNLSKLFVRITAELE